MRLQLDTTVLETAGVRTLPRQINERVTWGVSKDQRGVMFHHVVRYHCAQLWRAYLLYFSHSSAFFGKAAFANNQQSLVVDFSSRYFLNFI